MYERKRSRFFRVRLCKRCDNGHILWSKNVTVKKPKLKYIRDKHHYGNIIMRVFKPEVLIYVYSKGGLWFSHNNGTIGGLHSVELEKGNADFTIQKINGRI